MAAVTVTQAELLDALAEAMQGAAPSDAMTVGEMASAKGIHAGRIRKALQQLKADGRLVVHRVTRLDIGDRPQQVMAYTILPAKKKRSA